MLVKIFLLYTFSIFTQAKIRFFAQKATLQGNIFSLLKINIPLFCTIILFFKNVYRIKISIFVQLKSV